MTSPFIFPNDQYFINVRDEFLSSIDAITLGPFRYLMDWYRHPISYELLSAVLHFWDVELHVFGFGIDELCPTYEEFAAFLQVPVDLPMAYISGDHVLMDILSDMLDITVGVCSRLIIGDRLDLVMLILHGQRTTNVSARRFIACLVLVADILLVTGSVDCDPSIIPLVYQVLHGCSLVPMILAETLNGLDLVAVGESFYFRGSPRLVYMWLLERFRLISPVVAPDYTAADFYERRIYISPVSDSEHLRWTLSERFDMIRWHVPWLCLDYSAVLELGGLKYVPLCGLTCISFYIPLRCLRQFNTRQWVIIPPATRLPHFEMLTLDRAESLRQLWESRVPYEFRLGEIGSFPLRRSLIEGRATQLVGFVGDESFWDMNWFFRFGFFPSFLGIADAYEVMESVRRARASCDLPWPVARPYCRETIGLE